MSLNCLHSSRSQRHCASVPTRFGHGSAKADSILFACAGGCSSTPMRLRVFWRERSELWPTSRKPTRNHTSELNAKFRASSRQFFPKWLAARIGLLFGRAVGWWVKSMCCAALTRLARWRRRNQTTTIMQALPGAKERRSYMNFICSIGDAFSRKREVGRGAPRAFDRAA